MRLTHIRLETLNVISATTSKGFPIRFRNGDGSVIAAWQYERVRTYKTEQSAKECGLRAIAVLKPIATA